MRRAVPFVLITACASPPTRPPSDTGALSPDGTPTEEPTYRDTDGVYQNSGWYADSAWHSAILHDTADGSRSR